MTIEILIQTKTRFIKIRAIDVIPQLSE